jgi:hypothetical protein
VLIFDPSRISLGSLVLNILERAFRVVGFGFDYPGRHGIGLHARTYGASFEPQWIDRKFDYNQIGRDRADRGKYREVAWTIAPAIRKSGRAAGKKVEPQFPVVFGFLLLTLAFDVHGFMRELTKAKRALAI